MTVLACATPTHDFWLVYFSQKENILQVELGSGGVKFNEPLAAAASVKSMAESRSRSTWVRYPSTPPVPVGAVTTLARQHPRLASSGLVKERDSGIGVRQTFVDLCRDDTC